MKKKVLGLFSILIIVVLLFSIVKTDVTNINAEKEQATGEIGEIVINHGLIVYADDLIKDSTAEADMKSNTEYLQRLINEVSSVGGGTIRMPAGTYYFSIGGTSELNKCDYVVKCANNVTLSGAGNNEEGTILKPYGESQYGIDMFWYNDFVDSNGTNTTYLENADFEKFVIDGENATGNEYATTGKGFNINLFKDCDWDSVVVKNTFATGFGMANPINSTIENCKAEGCGVGAQTTDYGAAGFGIGIGYSAEEYIYISNCEATGNKRYGFYFEHQGRYLPEWYKATKAIGFAVVDSVGKDNLYDFGGEYAYDVTFINCKSDSSIDAGNNYRFMNSCVRTNVINGRGNTIFTDVTDSNEYWYVPVYWANNNGVASGYTRTKFAPNDPCLRQDAVAFLYKMDIRKGELTFEKQNTGFTDIDNDERETYYRQAIIWAVENGYISGYDSTTFAPNDGILREDFMAMLWRYAGRPEAPEDCDMPGIEDGAYYEKAFDWALSKGIIRDEVAEAFTPQQVISRKDVITYLYRYANEENNFSITYNLQGGQHSVSDENVEYNYNAGTEEITIEDPIREGYIFEGWIGKKYENDVSVTVKDTDAGITTEDRGNKTYVAIWKPNTYTISFDANGGTGNMVKQSFKYDMPRLLLPNEFTKDGFEFDGWNTKADGTGTKYTNAQAIKNLTTNNGEEITLYAQWKETSTNNKNNIFIGSGAWLEMRNIVESNDIYSASRTENIDWLKNIGVPTVEEHIKADTNVILRFGHNELFYEGLNNGVVDVKAVAEEYARYLNPKIMEWLNKGANVYVVSVGPYDEEKIEGTERKVNNADAEAFNAKLIEMLNGEIFIDTYTSMKAEIEANPDLTRDDGTNGIPLYYSKLYEIIKEQLGQAHIPTNEALNNMNDVPEDSTYYIPVKWAYENVYINPKTETTFDPDGKLTRGEAMSLIWKSQGMPYVSNSDKFQYTDVKQDALYYDAVMWGTEHDICVGFNTPAFAPDVNCTRGYYITFIWRLAGSPSVTTGNNFTDIEDGMNYTNAINWAVSQGIINEDLNGEFKPLEDITREDAVKWLYNYYNKNENVQVSYKIEHYLQNIDNDEYTIDENATQELSGIIGNKITPNKVYEGFTVTEGTETVEITEDNQIIKCYYARNKYLVQVVLGEGSNGILRIESKGEYKYGEKVELGAVLKDGYDKNTLEWSGDYTTHVFAMPNKEVMMSVTVEPIEYTITYNLDGGINNTANPTKYTVEDEITLKAPTKEGYEFIGWTKNNEETSKIDFTISKGTTDNLQFKANWKLKDYTIDYKLNGGNVDGNPKTYTIETETFTLINPTRTGYTFIGWTDESGKDLGKNITIEKGTKGNLSFIAKWEVNSTDEPKDLKVEISYSPEGPTNKNVTVIISANNKIKPIEGWTLSEDGKSISKVYEQNANEKVTIEDEYGNKKEQQITVNNIDKTPPKVTVEYVKQDDGVKVIVKSDEELQEKNGWELSEDKKTMTKIYDVSKEEEVSFFDLAGNETKKTIKVEIKKESDDGEDNNAGTGNTGNDGTGNNAGTGNSGNDGTGNNAGTGNQGNDSTDKDSTGGNKTDTTVSNKDIPKAGLKYVFGTGIALAVLGVLSFAKMKKYKDIK